MVLSDCGRSGQGRGIALMGRAEVGCVRDLVHVPRGACDEGDPSRTCHFVSLVAARQIDLGPVVIRLSSLDYFKLTELPPT